MANQDCINRGDEPIDIYSCYSEHSMLQILFKAYTCNYLARAVSSLEPDLGKAVVSDFVRTLSLLCPTSSCMENLLDEYMGNKLKVQWLHLTVSVFCYMCIVMKLYLLGFFRYWTAIIHEMNIV